MARRKVEAIKYPNKSHPHTKETREKISRAKKAVKPDSKEAQTRFGGKKDPRVRPDGTIISTQTTKLESAIRRGDFWLDFFSNIIDIEDLATYGKSKKHREKILRKYAGVFKKTYHDDVIPETLGERRAYALSFDRALDFETEKWVMDRTEGKAIFKLEAQVENSQNVFVRGFALPDSDNDNIREE